jgi:Outer membrane protein beta-barrel domain
MKYFLFTLLLSLSFSVYSFAQTEIRGSMGIDFISSPSLTDYLNQTYAGGQLGSFNSAIIFSVEADRYLKENYQVGLEFSYLINSFNFNQEFNTYNLSYYIIMPAILNYYVVQGAGYEFKFGGGIGIPFVIADEKTIGIDYSTKYKSTGVGIILRVDGNTILSGNIYVNVGADLKYELNGKPKNGNRYLVNRATGENINFNSFSAGIHLGITYRF